MISVGGVRGGAPTAGETSRRVTLGASASIPRSPGTAAAPSIAASMARSGTGISKSPNVKPECGRSPTCAAYSARRSAAVARTPRHSPSRAIASDAEVNRSDRFTAVHNS